MLDRTLALSALALCSSVQICARAADMPPSAEVAILRSAVISKCHVPLTDDDKAYGEVLRTSLQMELDQIWTELHAATPSAIVNKADEIFREWFDGVKAAAELKVMTLDCVELERQTKPSGG